MLGQLFDGFDVGSGLVLDLDAFLLGQPRRLKIGLVTELDDLHSDTAIECHALVAGRSCVVVRIRYRRRRRGRSVGRR